MKKKQCSATFAVAGCVSSLGLAALIGFLSARPVAAQEPQTPEFSAELGFYPRDATAKTLLLDSIYARTLTQVELTPPQQSARRAVIKMYRDFGIDVSLDRERNPSSILIEKMPRTWSTKTPQPLEGDYLQPYSIDAPWNHPIPRNAPRVALPEGYFQTVALTSPGSRNAHGGDGLGIGLVFSGPSDPIWTLASAGTNQSIRAIERLHIREDCAQFLSTNAQSDQRLIFVDRADNTVVETYETRLPGDRRGITRRGNEQFKQEGLRLGFDCRALATSTRHRLDGIGAEGVAGTDAAGIPLLGLTLRPGEATHSETPITHALGGCASALMKGRVYPARGWNSFIDTCEANRGCVPYGGLIQLDPDINLDEVYRHRKLSQPAYRILQALQTYGWYLCDSSDNGSGKGVQFQIYGSAPASEFAAYRPPSSHIGGIYGISNELQDFFQGKSYFGIAPPRFYVVAPLVKRP